MELLTATEQSVEDRAIRLRCLELAVAQYGIDEAIVRARQMVAFVDGDADARPSQIRAVAKD